MTISGHIFGCHSCGMGVAIGIQWVEAGNVVKYFIMHRTVPDHKELSVVMRLRNPVLRTDPHHKGIPFFLYKEYSHFYFRVRTGEGRRRHSTDPSGLCFFTVVRKDNMKSILLTNCLKYSTVLLIISIVDL